MQKKTEKFMSKISHLIFTLLSLISAILFNCFNIRWVFIDKSVFFHFCEMLLVIMVLNTVFLGALSCSRLYELKGGGSVLYEKRPHRIFYGITSVLSVCFLIFVTIYSIGLLTGEDCGVTLLQLQATLTKALPLIAIISLAAFYPAVGCKAKKLIASLVIIAAGIWIINDFIPLTPYKITSDPVVIDTSEDYSVVFSTNDYGTGYVEYTYEGESYKVYDHTAGRLTTDSKIHNISVPYEHLRNNTYTVGSVRVINDFSYGSRLGKEAKSEEYSFKFNDKDNQTYLVVSDWHTLLEEAYSAISYLGDYDAVLLMGDASPGVDYEDEVIRNTVIFGGKISGGTKPVIYVRGNHETRGAYANKLPDALGLDELYYTLDMGPYSFIVLDSGEDKEDSHCEYGGLTAYGDYRADMLEWLKAAEVTNDKVIALSHSWKISDVEQELSVEGWNEIDRLGARLMISGHTHQCRLIGENDEYEQTIFGAHPDIIGYMDGGKTDKNYVASKLTLSSEGFTLEAVNNLGENIFTDSFSW